MLSVQARAGLRSMVVEANDGWKCAGQEYRETRDNVIKRLPNDENPMSEGAPRPLHGKYNRSHISEK